MDYTTTFMRCEKKYLINQKQYDGISQFIRENMKPDEFGETTIYDIYFDTPDFRIIRRSLEGPTYKEKLRLRCYGKPEDHSPAFVELKKKFRGVVYKRRVDMDYESAESYLTSGGKPEIENQIMKEIDWFMSFYPNVTPRVVIIHDRCAFFGNDDPELRLTFDKNILWRNFDFDLKSASLGQPLLNEGEYLMEIKFANSMPIGLAHLLDRYSVFPSNYSKYGAAYKSMIKKDNNRGVIVSA